MTLPSKARESIAKVCGTLAKVRDTSAYVRVCPRRFVEESKGTTLEKKLELTGFGAAGLNSDTPGAPDDGCPAVGNKGLGVFVAWLLNMLPNGLLAGAVVAG